MRDSGRPRRASGASRARRERPVHWPAKQFLDADLERSALGESFKSDPQTVFAELNSGLGKPDERDRLFALSELSFAYAEKSGNQSYYLASAAYVRQRRPELPTFRDGWRRRRDADLRRTASSIRPGLGFD
jgi:hypothetical protein